MVMGDGPADLVYMPTVFGGFEAFWDYAPVKRFFERLTEFARVVSFDRRGTGMSDPPITPAYSLEDQMDDVIAVMDGAGVERAHVFSQLEGTSLACLFAGSHPERVSSLALYCPFARATRAEGYPFGLTVEERQAQIIEPSLAAWGTGSRAGGAAPSLSNDPEFIEWFARIERLTGAPSTMRRLLEQHNHTDVRAILREVRVPTLIMSRSNAPFYDPGHARYVAERIPGARFLELEGQDVLVAAEGSDELIEEIEEFITGVRPERAPDRVLATVLFTDIVGSTERAAALGDARWRELLERHNELVRRHLLSNSGREVKSTGDGFLATFDGPARGVRCATGIAEEVRRLGIEIRAGLHTGECEVMGDDVGGMAVHIGSRVASQADAGEVRVSGTVRDLVAGSGIEFEDRGMTALKGIPGEWRLYAVVPPT